MHVLNELRVGYDDTNVGQGKGIVKHYSGYKQAIIASYPNIGLKVDCT